MSGLRPVSFLLGHHESKAGRVSGAWEGVGDTLWHLQGAGHGHARLFMQKVRWASDWQGRTLHLEWAPGKSFVVSEKPEVDDETIGDALVAAIRENPGTGWTKIAAAAKGIRDERRRSVRDGLFADGLIVNVVRRDGVEVAIRECPQGAPARLYLADDPTIAHLIPDSDAVGTQLTTDFVPGRDEAGTKSPYRGPGVIPRPSSLRPSFIGTKDDGTKMSDPGRRRRGHRLVSRRRIFGFVDKGGEYRELRDPFGAATGAQLARLNRLGMLDLVDPARADPIRKGEAAAAINDTRGAAELIDRKRDR